MTPAQTAVRLLTGAKNTAAFVSVDGKRVAAKSISDLLLTAVNAACIHRWSQDFRHQRLSQFITLQLCENICGSF